MEIKDSVGKRGHSDDEIRHALENAIRAWPDDGFNMFVGPLRDGTLVEVGAKPDGVVFHVMKARSQFL